LARLMSKPLTMTSIARPPTETQPTEEASEAGTREDDRHRQASPEAALGEIIDEPADPPTMKPRRNAPGRSSSAG
jgi:hypothetical protein